MQPNFTLKKLGFVSVRIFALALIFGLTAQSSFSQEKRQRQPKVSSEQQAERERQKLERANTVIQDRAENSFGLAPAQTGSSNVSNLANIANPLSRAFPYTVAAGAHQLNAQSLSNTTLTPRGATVVFGFAGAEAWNTLTNVLYVVDQAAPYALYTVDTLTGVRTFVVNCTGVPHANLTGMTWDPSSNIMYGISSSITQSQIFTINITTGVCTPIGAPTATVAGGIMINAAPGGSLFTVDIVSDNLYKWNKSTGVPTLVGSLGINTNFGQDGHFDFSDGQYYWATINAGAANARQLRVIDTTNGSSTLVGTYPAQVASIGIYSIPLIPCAGAPAPGNTISTVPTVCPATNFTLSLQNTITTSGNTFQWQSGPSAAGPWTNVPGATNPTLVTNITTATSYQCIVTCTNGGLSTTSTPVTVALTPPSGCYCIPPATNCTDDDEMIRVQISTLNNASGCSAGPPAGYGDYTNTVAAPDVQAGVGNVITVSYKTLWSKSAAVWIDYNHSGSFEANEFTSLGSGPAATAQLSASINIPGSALAGITRMRVRTRFGTAGYLNTQACTNPSGFAETEDYNVNILPCVPITSLSTLPTRTIQCSGSTSYTISANGGTVATYQWEYRMNSSSPWQFVTNGGIYSGATTPTLTLDNVSEAFNGYQYRAVVTGGCSGVEFSNTSILTVNPLIATVSPVSATICTGSVQQLSLTNASSPTTVTFTNNTPLPVPDNTPAGVYSTIAVSGIPAGAIITNVSIRTNINHTWVGDMENNIIAPNGVSLSLMAELDNGTGSNGSNDFINTVLSSSSTVPLSGAPAPRTGTFAADRLQGYGPSANFQTNASGMPWSLLYTTMNGDWRLGLSDWFAFDTGILNNWSISITYGAPAAGVWTGQAGTMWLDAAASIPYVPGSVQNTIYVNPTATTNYSVVYSTATPCTSPATVIPITVVNPVGTIASPTSAAVCVGGTVSFTSTAGGGPVTRQWQRSIDGGVTWTNITGQTGATLTLSNATIMMHNYRYRALYTAAPCLGSTASASATLTVNALPVVAITAPDLLLTPPSNGNTVVTGTSSPAAAANGWAWTLNGATITGTTNTQNVGIDQLGTYQATVTDINGCVSMSNELVIGAEASDRLWIYPNPTDGQFQVRLFFQNNRNERRIVTVFNAIGMAVATRTFDLTYTSSPYLRMDFDLTAMAPGTYVVKVANAYSGKVISGLVVVH